MENKHIQLFKSIWTNLCRFVLAAVFVFSGFAKIIDPWGSFYKLQDYALAFGALWVPDFLLLLLGVLLAAIELITGLLLFVGVRRTISTFTALVLMSIMTPLTLVLALTNPISDCGCFGDALILTNWETFIKNIILLGLSISLYRRRRGILSLFTNHTHWIVALYTAVFVAGLFIYSYRYLPIIDFRPFKIGTHMLSAMEMPDGAEEAVFETYVLMEKDGQEKLFDLNNYPDSTWTYLDTQTKLISKGYVPPIQNFHMLDLESSEDIAQDFLANSGYSFLMIAGDLTQADDGEIDLLNEIYDYSVDHKYPFVCLTASQEKDIESWSDRTGAEYPFYFTDEITLKTMVRANPGLILLKDGVIIQKWSYHNLPTEYDLSDSLDRLPLGQITDHSDFKKILYVIFWYFAPMFMLFGLDLLYRRRKTK